MNQPAGRQWRNTLVFVQPKNGKKISETEQTEKFLEKANEVIGAKIRKEDENLKEEIRDQIEGLYADYEDDLEDRIESAYGEVIDGDDLLNQLRPRCRSTTSYRRKTSYTPVTSPLQQRLIRSTSNGTCGTSSKTDWTGGRKRASKTSTSSS